MLKLKLDRPLAVFDIEATGISPRADRIVEIAVVRINPDGKRTSSNFRINPGIPIPPDSTRIHGITDQDVKDCPSFRDLAQTLSRLFSNCDLCGYNILRFDVPMLTEEFIRAGTPFSMEGRRIIDPQRIFHQREPRDLTAALAFYCGEMHIDAHGALPDVQATIRVLEGQYDRYNDLPVNIDELNDYCNPRDPSWADRTGKLRWSDDQIVINFGKKKGTSIASLIKNDMRFIDWLLKSDFPVDTRQIITDAMEGKWPAKPASPDTQT